MLRQVFATVLAVVVVLALHLGASPLAGAKDVPLTFEMKQVRFFPDFVRVVPGDNVTVRVFNNDTNIGHTFDLDEFGVHLGTAAQPINFGESRSKTFNASREGVFWFYCSVPGHATRLASGRWEGMAGQIQVGTPTEGAGDATLILGIGLAVLLVTVAIVVIVARRAKKGRQV